MGKLNKKQRCRGCCVEEGSKQHIQMQQDWIPCQRCTKWYHEECAERNV